MFCFAPLKEGEYRGDAKLVHYTQVGGAALVNRSTGSSRILYKVHSINIFNRVGPRKQDID